MPEDISVVGFDNYLYPGLSDIGITTYDVNVREMVKKSISILLDRINHVKIKPGVRIVQGEIVYKESVMPPNKDKT